MAPSFAAVKGVIHAPSAKPAMKVESRDALLTAIRNEGERSQQADVPGRVSV